MMVGTLAQPAASSVRLACQATNVPPQLKLLVLLGAILSWHQGLVQPAPWGRILIKQDNPAVYHVPQGTNVQLGMLPYVQLEPTQRAALQNVPLAL